jgi:nucleoside-diphosphate-sugar epimerase
MRVVVTGATGNVGTSVLEALAAREEVTEIIGIARRSPSRTFEKTTFIAADVTSADLETLFQGASAVIHLAWLIQPGRTESITRSVNVGGSERVFAAVVKAGVPTLVYASSVGAYSPGPKDQFVDESWPTEGIDTSFYSRHKAAVERMLDDLERDSPQVRVVRMRPGLLFKAEAATEIRRLFAGPFLPQVILRRRLVPFVPQIPSLRFQLLHSTDVGRAYALAVVNRHAQGAFNLAAEPPIGSAELAQVMAARPLAMSPRLLRAAADLAFRLRLSPTEPGWLDLALQVPLMDSGRARDVLGWSPNTGAIETLTEMIDGLGRGSDFDTPPLARSTTAPFRIKELKTRLGARP